MVVTILFRYLGTIIQFAVLSTIAKNTSPDEYGLYMLCLSVVFSAYYVVGLGSSETAVIYMPRYTSDQKKNEMGLTIGSVLAASVLSAAVIIIVAAAVYAMNSHVGDTVLAVTFTLFFVAMNGVMFNVSQLLLGMGRSSLGSFFFYPATNITLLLSTVPAALFMRHVPFSALTTATSLGSFIASTLAVAMLLWASRHYNLAWTVGKFWALSRTGLSLTSARILHVTSFWIPTMVTGFMLSPQIAGIIGTSGRLAIAVSAVIAALRFVVRPTLSRAVAVNDTAHIKKVCGSLAFCFIVIALLALVMNEILGVFLVATFFGTKYLLVQPILRVFLIGVIAEGVYGPVDELLKMTGRQKEVMTLYSVCVPLFLVATMLASFYNWSLIAWMQVIYVLILFSAMNILLYCKDGYFLIPTLPDFSVLRTIR